jgi:outer membrane immunogenic protein
MKRSLLAGLGLVSLFTGPVVAADLPVKAPAAKPSPVYNWTGCYGGAHFGSLFVQQNWAGLGADNDAGLVLGGQLGCNYQISTWVFGVQGDGAWSNASGTHNDVAGLTDEWKTDSLASVTGRFGYAWDRLLAYTKGGGAWKHDKYDIATTATAAAFSTAVATASETRSGWTVGGGFEYAITNNLSMFFEYDFYDFGTKTVGFTSAAGGPQTVDIRDRDSLIKVGGNWKFNW